MPLKLSFSAVIAELGYHIMRAGMMARSTCVSSAGSSREKEEEKAKKKKKSPDRYSTLCCVCIDAIVTLGVFLYLFDFGQRVIYTQKTLTFIPNHLYSFFFLSLLSISSMSNGICPGPVFNILVPVQLLNLDCIFNNVSPPAVTFSFWFSFFLFLLLLFFLPPLLLDIYCIHLFFLL